jgi:HEAT repeat protein
MEMPVDNAVSILKNATWEQITVAKEIIRLLGDLGTDTAYQELLAWNERDLHRDVRIALLRAL